MKQTENYSLNLLELSDPLSLKPLNENAQTVDTVLEEHASAIQGRVMMACGSYTGNGTRTVSIRTPGFKPQIVLMKTAQKVGFSMWKDTTGANHFEEILSSIGVSAGWCLWLGSDVSASYRIYAIPRDESEPTSALVDTTIQFVADRGELTWSIGEITDYDNVTTDEGPTVMNNASGVVYEWIAFGTAE